MTRVQLSISLCVALLCGELCLSHADGAHRTVSVTVEIMSVEGEPFADYGLFLKSSIAEEAAITDATGKMKFIIEVTPSDELVTLSREGVTEKWSDESRQKSATVGKRLREDSYFPYFRPTDPPLVVRLEANRTEYELRLTSSAAVHVKGRVVDGDSGHPIVREAGFYVRHASSISPTRTDPSGAFTLHGLPRNIENDVFVRVLPFVQRIRIPRGQLTQNTDLGVIKVKRKYAGVSLEHVDIRVVGWDKTRALLHRESIGGATLISLDGKTIVSLQQGLVVPRDSHSPDQVGREYDFEKEWPEIPIGTYLVIPETFRAAPHQLAILDAIERGSDFDQLEIPILDVEPGHALAITIDAAKTMASINSVIAAIPIVDVSPEATTRPAPEN